jgi:hypothetical protein
MSVALCGGVAGTGVVVEELERWSKEREARGPRIDRKVTARRACRVAIAELRKGEKAMRYAAAVVAILMARMTPRKSVKWWEDLRVR